MEKHIILLSVIKYQFILSYSASALACKFNSCEKYIMALISTV